MTLWIFPLIAVVRVLLIRKLSRRLALYVINATVAVLVDTVLRNMFTLIHGPVNPHGARLVAAKRILPSVTSWVSNDI